MTLNTLIDPAIHHYGIFLASCLMDVPVCTQEEQYHLRSNWVKDIDGTIQTDVSDYLSNRKGSKDA